MVCPPVKWQHAIEHWLHKFVRNLLTLVIPAWFHSAPQSFLWCHRMIRSLSLRCAWDVIWTDEDKDEGTCFLFACSISPAAAGEGDRSDPSHLELNIRGRWSSAGNFHTHHSSSTVIMSAVFFLDYRVFCPHREHGGCFYQPLLKMFSSKRDKNVPFECVLQALS